MTGNSSVNADSPQAAEQPASPNTRVPLSDVLLNLAREGRALTERFEGMRLRDLDALLRAHAEMVLSVVELTEDADV